MFSVDENAKLIGANDSHINSLSISKIRDTPWARTIRRGDDKPLSNRELTRVLGGKDFCAMAKGYKISDHITGDAWWRSTTTIVWCYAFQHSAKLNMGPPDDASANEVGANPFPSPHGTFNRSPRLADIASRDGAADPPNLGVWSDDSESDMAPPSYRSFPETDTWPPHRVLLGELIRLRH